MEIKTNYFLRFRFTLTPKDTQSVEVEIIVHKVNTSLSSISTYEDDIQRIFIPNAFKTDDFFLVADSNGSEVCSNISVQGSDTTHFATFGPNVRLMLQSQDFPYGALVTISNIPKEDSVCYTSKDRGSNGIKITSISIEDVSLPTGDIILCSVFSLVIFGCFFGLTYLPKIWPQITRIGSRPEDQEDPIPLPVIEENQTPLQIADRVDSKRQTKKKQHKRLYKTLGTLLLIAIIGSIMAIAAYFYHYYRQDTTDHDKCYFNEECLVVFHINKHLSNLQFVLYGLALILAPILSNKKCQLEQVSFGMGILLILQGINSTIHHICPGQDSLFIDRIPMHFLFSLGLFVILNHMIPKHAKTKACLCCFAPTLTVTMEVLVSFKMVPSNIGSWCLKVLAFGFVLALIVDLVIYYKNCSCGSFIKRLKEKNTLPFFILSILVTIPASIAVFFFQAKSMDSKETPVMSREYNQNCLLGIYDQHDLWHIFSSSAIYLGYFTLYKSYSYT